MPRNPNISVEGGRVVSCAGILTGKEVAGERVAIMGAGDIGFDVAEFLTVEPNSTANLDAWLDEWGVTDPELHRAGLAQDGANPAHRLRQVSLFQRKDERPGRRLGRTTGWIHRTSLRMNGVRMEGGVTYEKVDSDDLHITRRDGAREVVPADTVVLCTGQLSDRALADALIACGASPHVIGGADLASGLDARRAMDQGARLAARLWADSRTRLKNFCSSCSRAGKCGRMIAAAIQLAVPGKATLMNCVPMRVREVSRRSLLLSVRMWPALDRTDRGDAPNGLRNPDDLRFSTPLIGRIDTHEIRDVRSRTDHPRCMEEAQAEPAASPWRWRWVKTSGLVIHLMFRFANE